MNNHDEEQSGISKLPILYSLSENETGQSKSVTEAEHSDAPPFHIVLPPSATALCMETFKI